MENAHFLGLPKATLRIFLPSMWPVYRSWELTLAGLTPRAHFLFIDIISFLSYKSKNLEMHLKNPWKPCVSLYQCTQREIPKWMCIYYRAGNKLIYFSAFPSRWNAALRGRRKSNKMTYLQQYVTEDTARWMPAFLWWANLFCQTPVRVHSCAALSPTSHLVLNASQFCQLQLYGQ